MLLQIRIYHDCKLVFSEWWNIDKAGVICLHKDIGVIYKVLLFWVILWKFKFVLENKQNLNLFKFLNESEGNL